MLAILLALLAASGAAPTAARDAMLPGEVSESLARALTVPTARLVPVRWSAPSGCRVESADVVRPVDGSGRFPVRISGRGCGRWGWVELEVWAETSVTTRAVHVGEALRSASTVAEREVHPGRLPFIVPADALAKRSLPSGAAIDASDVTRSKLMLGDPVRVVFVSGAVSIEAQGRRGSCIGGRDCAILASGKHVEGYLDDRGRLIVEVPR